jgi:hypothetical protein
MTATSDHKQTAHELQIERNLFAEAKQELDALRVEHRDLVAQKSYFSAAVAAAEDLKRQCTQFQV